MAAVPLALILCVGPGMDGRTVCGIVVQVNEDNRQVWNLMLNDIGHRIGATGNDAARISVA